MCKSKLQKIFLYLIITASFCSVSNHTLQAMTAYYNDSTNQIKKYVKGRVVMRVTVEAYQQMSQSLRLAGGSSIHSGITSVDNVLNYYDVRQVKSFLLDPNNDSLFESLGMNRIIIASVDTMADIELLVSELKNVNDIQDASPDWIPRFCSVPDDPLYEFQWGHDNQVQCIGGVGYTHENGIPVGVIGMDADIDLAWDLSQGYGDTSIIIAIIDSGVDSLHPDLRITRGFNAETGGNDFQDAFGHGTACAGVAAAIANNGIGVAGVAGGCTIMPIKFSSLVDAATAIIYAVDSGAHVISMSWGGVDVFAVEDAVEYAYGENVIMFASAGNVVYTVGNPSPLYPAAYSEVIGVGAMSPCGEWKNQISCDGENAWMSQWGDYVDIVAPTILPTTDILGVGGFNTASSPEGDYFRWFNGTSCSAPFAAGVAALLLSADSTHTPESIRELLKYSARDIEACGEDVYTGSGLVNAYHALTFQVYDNPSPNIITVGPNETFQSIQTAIDSADDCTTILVKPGTYTETINFKSKNITLKSTCGPHYTIISIPTGPCLDLVEFESGESEYSVIEGFTLRGGRRVISCESSRPTIRKNVIRTGSGNCTSDMGIGIYAGSPASESTYLYQAPAIIENNTITGTLHDLAGLGIWSSSEGKAPVIRNCVIAFNNYGIFRFKGLDEGNGSGGRAPEVIYSNVYDNAYGDYTNCSPSTGSFAEDPQFRQHFSLEQELSSNSPCIDAGDPDPQYNDLDGSSNDVGAFLYTPDTIFVPSDYSFLKDAIEGVYYESGVILVDSGIYTEIGIDFVARRIQLKSIHGPLKTKIVSPGGSGTFFNFESGEDSTTLLEGFRIDGGDFGVICKNSSPTIKRCLFLNQSPNLGNSGSINLWGAITNSVGISPAKIINCTIIGSSKSGIVDRSTSPPLIKNTIVYDNDEYGIRWWTNLNKPQEHPELSYNCVNANTTDYGGGISDSGVGSIHFNPMLFWGGTLMSSSPCINAGDPDPVYNDPDGSRNDMGFSPYQPPTFPPPSPKEQHIPMDFSLLQNYPNPFNPKTTISFSVPVKTEYELSIYNLLGQRVKVFNGNAGPGFINLDWDASRFASGIYLYILTAGEYTASKKLVVLK